MSGIILGQTRFEFHTLTQSGTTFSIPPQEDFTIEGTTMSWTITDLGLSEIGVNEGDNKAYIRIGDNINEFSFSGGGAGSWASTLAVNNNSQTYSAIMGTATNISSANGGAFIALDYASTPTSLWLDPNSINNNVNLELYENGINLGVSTNDSATSSFIQIYTNRIDTATQQNILYPTLQGAAGNSITDKGDRITSTNSTTLNISTIQGCDSINVGIEIEATIYGRYGYTSSYGSKLYGVFKYNGATTSQVNTTDKVEKTEFSTTTSDIVTDGTNIYVTITGENSKSIDWSNFYIKYNITT